METILTNSAHFIECASCGSKITETPHEVWANVPDHEVDWAKKDNARMSAEADEFWDKRVAEFSATHNNCPS